MSNSQFLAVCVWSIALVLQLVNVGLALYYHDLGRVMGWLCASMGSAVIVFLFATYPNRC